VGTGGVLVHARSREALLAAALADPAAPQSLRPVAPRMVIDAQYALYAVGLLAQVDPAAALRLGRSVLASNEGVPA
jgi:hypothetical protein